MSFAIRIGLLVMLALASGFSMLFTTSPAQAADVTIGRFPPIAAVQSVLRRGASREVVRDALGEPNGSGHARIPPSHTPHEVWYYEDIEVEDASSQHDYVRLDVRQRILLVFFDGDRVDGFLWTSNKGDAEAKSK